MNLRSTLRKAAELLVELPPETEPTPPTPGHSAGAAGSDIMSTDQLWAELEKASQPPKASSAPVATKTVEQIVRDANGPDLDQIQVDHSRLPDAAPDGSTDFGAIYRAANLPTSPYSAEQVLEMLASLPAELSLDSRRRMVRAAVNSMGKAIGASPETIVADASRKLAALTAYTENLAQLTTEYTSTAEKKIAVLEAQIAETRAAMEAARLKQANQTAQCTAESHRLDEVLEFFSLDVAPSRYAAPEASGR